jgi:F-type H+-transporting ATPase subunit delta
MAQDLHARDAQLVAQLDADAGREHIADVYAEAFLGVGQDAGRVEELMEELDSIISEVLNVFPEFEGVLGSALIPHEEKLALVDRVYAGRVSNDMLNFLRVLSRHGRMDCLRAIHRQAHRQLQRLQGRVPVQVVSAVPLDDRLLGLLGEQLRKIIGGEPVFDQVVDPDIIGGMVVRVGDTVYDASVTAQLKQLRQQMIDRSAHEIQSRRDRFRYPAGS